MTLVTCTVITVHANCYSIDAGCACLLHMLSCILLIWYAGVLAVIAVGVILVATAAAFGVRSLFQIRDQMAKAKAGYSTVELSDPHQNMETGMLPEDSSPRHSPMAGSPRRGGREDGKQH